MQTVKNILSLKLKRKERRMMEGGRKYHYILRVASMNYMKCVVFILIKMMSTMKKQFFMISL